MAQDIKPEPQISIRQVTEDDLPTILEIDHRITGSERAMTYASRPLGYVGGELSISMIAEIDGQIAGFLFGRLIDSPYGHADTASLEVIGVDPAYRRRGIGTRLVLAFTEHCQQEGAKSVRIVVSWHDWWYLSFLRSLGFVRGEMAEFIKSIEE